MQLLSEAAIAYREALKVFTHKQMLGEYIRAQHNLGSALRLQGEQLSGEESLRLLAESITIFRDNLKVISREQRPGIWADTQINLGGALVLQGQQSKDQERARLLAEGIAAYREALKIRTFEKWPQSWATIQDGLSIAFESQSEQLSDEESVKVLAEAVIACREALKVRSLEQSPRDWAATQTSLGNALRLQGERLKGEQSARLLTEAISAHRETLKVYSRERLPEDWARTQNNLAKTYLLLKNWKDAAVSFENVLAVFPYYEQGYQSLASIYHERLFEYPKAFALHQQWLSRFPKNASAQADFAETHFTTGRFAEFAARLKPLLAHPELPAATKLALQMIEVANLLALDRAAQVPAALAALIKTIEAQPADFRITWSFAGTLHFINQQGQQQEKLAAYRAWLNQFFAVAQGADRDAILKTLRAAQAQFSPAK